MPQKIEEKDSLSVTALRGKGFPSGGATVLRGKASSMEVLKP